MTDPSQINNSLNQQLPTNNRGGITAAVLRAALTTGVAGSLGLTAWIAATFAPITTTLPHVPNNAALQAIVPTLAGQVYVRDGFYAAGDGGQATYTGSLTNCATPDNGAQVQPSGTGCWIVQAQVRYDDRIWGVKHDFNFSTNTGTDNTTTLAAALAYSQTSSAQGASTELDIAPGLILSGPQTITGQIKYECAGDWSSVFVLKSGSNAPMITYSPSGWTFPSIGYAAAQTHASHCRITSQDGSSFMATYPNAAGISIVNGSGNTLWNYIDYFNIYNMPGNCIMGQVSNGLTEFTAPYTQGCGGDGIYLNSVVDWVIDRAQIATSYGQANVVLSGAGRVYFHNLNSFASANGPGVYINGANNVIFDGHTEVNGNWNSGFQIDGLPSGYSVVISDLNAGQNSQASVNAFSDVWLTGIGSGTVLITRADFPAPYVIDNHNSSHFNIQYDGASTTNVVCSDCLFRGGPWNGHPQTYQAANYLTVTGALNNVPWTVSSGSGSPALPTYPAGGANTQAYVNDASSCSTRHGSLTGGGSIWCPVVFNGTISVTGATIRSGGSGGTNGTAVALTVIGGTCTTQPVLTGTISGGVLTAITGVANAGACSILPASYPTVNGNGLLGATVNLTLSYSGAWVQQ